MAQYNAQAVIPISQVIKDYFPHLNADNFVRKVSMGDINIPMIRIEGSSTKAAKGIHILDLAKDIDERREAALKEAKQLTSATRW